MGWTSYNADCYKNGKIDRIAEVEKHLVWGSSDTDNHCKHTILKSSLVGTTVYSAIEHIDSEGVRRVFATIFLTSINTKDYYNFFYKDMDESVGPCECDCPKVILNMLTPTDHEYAISWRDRCVEKAKNRKLDKKVVDGLSKLPLNSKIKITSGSNMGVILSKCWANKLKNPSWVDWANRTRYIVSYIKKYGYEIV